MKKFLPALVLISLLAAPVVLAVATSTTSTGVKPAPECMCTTVKHNLGNYVAGCEKGEVVCDEDTGYAIEGGALCCILDLMETVVDYAFVILLILAGVIIAFSAFQFATASGSTEKVKSARDKLIWALVGIIVAFGAKGIVKLVETMLT